MSGPICVVCRVVLDEDDHTEDGLCIGCCEMGTAAKEITTLRARVAELEAERDRMRPVCDAAVALHKRVASEDVADDDHGEELGATVDAVYAYLAATPKEPK